MELREVARDVYACLQPDRGWGWSNAGFVASGGGLMIDTFMDVPRTRRALALYAAVAPSPPRRLVNTHHNVDHCWGNQCLRGAEIIAHRACAERMRGDLRPEAMLALLAAPELSPGLRWFADDVRDFDFRGIEPTPPTRVLDDRLDLDLDGRRVEILHLGPAHTAGDVIVHLPDDGVVFAGDLLFRLCTPIGWEGTFARWIAALERIEALAPEVIVPGHGPLCGVEGPKELRAYLAHVVGESRRGFEQGLDVLEAARRMELGAFAGWTQPERVVFNVARAYRELRGGAWDEAVDFAPLLDAACELRRHWSRG